MISSKKGQRMMFPKVIITYNIDKIINYNFSVHHSSSSNWKNHTLINQGGWEADESVEEAAARESLEEAGVLGKVGVSIRPFSSLL